MKRFFNGCQIDNGVVEKGKLCDFWLNCDWLLIFFNFLFGRLNDFVVFFFCKGQIFVKFVFLIFFYFGIYCLEDIEMEWKGDLYMGFLGGVQ